MKIEPFPLKMANSWVGKQPCIGEEEIKKEKKEKERKEREKKKDKKKKKKKSVV